MSPPFEGCTHDFCSTYSDGFGAFGATAGPNHSLAGARADSALLPHGEAPSGPGPTAAPAQQDAPPLKSRNRGVSCGSPAKVGAAPRAGVLGTSARSLGIGPGAQRLGQTAMAGFSTTSFDPKATLSRGSSESVSDGISPLHHKVNAQVALIDQAFVTRDWKKFDEAHAGLQAIQGELSADPVARAAHRDALSALTALTQDATQLLEAVLEQDVDSMSKLADHFWLDDDLKTLPQALAGRCELDQDECLALSLYSVREKHMALGPEVFRAVNALGRAHLPAAAQALRFLTEPLESGMAKLPSLNNVQLRRGMQIGESDNPHALQDAKAQFAVSKTLPLGAPTTGSLIAAYPGNVVLMVQTAKQDSRLKDTSAFSYVGVEQQEATFLPGTHLQITREDEVVVPANWAEADGIVESSGRAWGDRVGKKVLMVHAKELSGEA